MNQSTIRLVAHGCEGAAVHNTYLSRVNWFLPMELGVASRVFISSMAALSLATSLDTVLSVSIECSVSVALGATVAITQS